jgi:hypothetical protein
MSRRRAITNLTVAPSEHAEEVGTLKDLGPTNQALRMLILATNSQVKIASENMLNFTCIRSSVFLGNFVV